MNMRCRAFLGLICLFFLAPLLTSQDVEKALVHRLNLALSFPRDENVFFQTTPFIALDNERNIYAVDNRQHVIFKLDSNGKFISKIGRKGQGPGDLEWPWLISVWNKAIFVADNTSISIFDLQGNFRNKFRTFHPLISLAPTDDKIFFAQIENGKIIHAYDYNGNKLYSFGNKYSVDYVIYRGWSNGAIDNWLNAGKLLYAGSRIYFITSLFGDIFAYDLKGNLISQKRMETNEFIEKNRALYFKKGMVNKGDGAFFHNKLFEDAYYYQGKIFVLLSSPAGNSCGEDIWQLDEKTLKIEKRYVLFNKTQRDKNWLRSLVVTSDHTGNNLFYVSLYDSKDFVINIYK